MTFHLRPLALEPEFEFVDSYCYVLAETGNMCYKDQTIDVALGQTIGVSARVKNVGDGAGAPTVKWYHGTTKLCEKTGASIAPGAIQDLQNLNCFAMPDANRDIVMKVYYGSREDDTIGHRALKHKLKRAWRRIRRY